jgi:phenylacetate-coenzyme A ligase PaaK-like adenylate-forming protein
LLKKENIIKEQLTDEEFLNKALQVFNYQYLSNKVYRAWVDNLKIQPHKIKLLEQIPFLPIEFFKNHQVICGEQTSSTTCFTSSTTTSQTPSKHFVTEIDWYEESFIKSFQLFYGQPKDFCFLALLPNYLERKGSSLVYMCQKLITLSNHPKNGFFLNNLHDLVLTIDQLKKEKTKVLLIGVSYALLDLCTKDIFLNENFIVMETGGMKGTRNEMLKPELHQFLKSGLKVKEIHSEYGMTELLSQAYSYKDGLFQSPPWMRFYIREVNDPLKIRSDSKTGGVNVIDLANVNSCSFIATKDLGRLHPNNQLELMGRYDNSDVRGCNLMMEQYT